MKQVNQKKTQSKYKYVMVYEFNCQIKRFFFIFRIQEENQKRIKSTLKIRSFIKHPYPIN